jgi:hypothetical protein
MTFTFKLSKRLARCKATPLAPARAQCTSRRASTTLPSWASPLSIVTPSQRKPSIRMGSLHLSQYALAEETVS